jgi:hypothetical protein
MTFGIPTEEPETSDTNPAGRLFRQKYCAEHVMKKSIEVATLPAVLFQGREDLFLEPHGLLTREQSK